ncbi:hypothetical protein [Streptomyces sp. LN699]|uniref:hypothetical protein n=1 Tax=Streptomyces sp. LN699 TaxID=3112981 RepID=UPI0037165012
MKITMPRRLLAASVLALATLAAVTAPGQAQPVAPAGRAAAAAALPGYQVMRGAAVTVDNFTRLTLSCPVGKVVVGGGGEAQGAAGVLVGSFPTLAGGSYRWNVVARQVGQSKVTASGYAICVDSAAMSGYQLIHLASANVANGSSRQVSCPVGKVVVGGGAETLGSNAALRFSLAPRPKSTDYMWTASGQSLSGSTTVGLAVDVICASPVAGYEIVELAAAETPNQTRRTLACPSGKTALSGGVSGYNTAVVTSTLPEYSSTGYGWTTTVREPSRPNAISGVTAVCANFA